MAVGMAVTVMLLKQKFALVASAAAAALVAVVF